MQKQNKMLCVVGPTASGKSSLAVELAKRFSGEVISCDSMQLYRDMNVGTAKVTEKEMCGVPHHLVDILDIHQEFSVSDYVTAAEACTNELQKRGKLPIFCGGTGLYIDSFTSGMNFGSYTVLPGLRESLQAEAETFGAAELHRRLAGIDPESAAAIEANNVKRVIRALEVYESTGISFSEWRRRAKRDAVPKKALYILLVYQNRELLYERIEKRIDQMMENGLLEETEHLIRKGLRQAPTASQAIGYKEFYPYFDGIAPLEKCVNTLKINSRHYAKRQLTWFMRNKEAKIFAVDTMSGKELLAQVSAECQTYLTEEELFNRPHTGGKVSNE